jgi:hypothetical protein
LSEESGCYFLDERLAMRMNFEFSEQRVGDLKKLLDETGTETMKDLVNNAFTILEWAVDETNAGNEIAAVNESEEVYRVLVMPVLQRVSKGKATSVSGSRHS